MPQDLTTDKKRLVQVMAWHRQEFAKPGSDNDNGLLCDGTKPSLLELLLVYQQ